MTLAWFRNSSGTPGERRAIIRRDWRMDRRTGVSLWLLDAHVRLCYPEKIDG